MNKVQEKQYELLCEFDRICKKCVDKGEKVW